MAKNEVFVTTDLQDERLWRKELKLTNLHWINEAPSADKSYQVRTRYRAPLAEARLTDDSLQTLKLGEEVMAVNPGQSAVLYDGDRCIGAGIVVCRQNGNEHV